MTWFKHNWFPVLGLVALVVSLFFLIVPLLFSWQDGGEGAGKLTGWSNYGQAFGAVAGMFAAAAFVVALYTLKVQQDQIEESNRQMATMQDNARRQTEAALAQAEVLRQAALAQACSAMFAYSATWNNDTKEMKELADEVRAMLREFRNRPRQTNNPNG